MAQVAFIEQLEPVDEYGRALYAVARSILRAFLDQLGTEDFVDLGETDKKKITLRQLSKIARLDRDKGQRGDGFEWAVHEAIVGGEPRVTEILVDTLHRTAKRMSKIKKPTSVMFGHERAKYLGFLSAVIKQAGFGAVLLPDGQGHPFDFGPWVAMAAGGHSSEKFLKERIKKIWKTDLFVGNEESSQYIATTIKSNWHQLEAGAGLRVGIVPEAPDLKAGIVRHQNGLYLAVLPDPNGFMGVFNDAYAAVAAAVCKLGRHDPSPYFLKPTAKGRRLQDQLEKYGTATVIDIEGALNEAAQQNLVGIKHQLVSVEAPKWLHMTEKPTSVVAPRPKFEPL